MMFWLGVYTLVMIVWRLAVIVTRNGTVKVETTGTVRLVAILMNLPMLWFVYTAWGMYR